MKTRLLVAAAFLVFAVTPIRAGTTTVTTTNDSGSGSLRAALASAANGDTVNFSVSGTILLTSGELLVSSSVKILGTGPNLAINGNASDRVFHIGSGTAVTISSLTITNGRASGQYPSNSGGGIYNDHAALTISNCNISGNVAALGSGISNDGVTGGTATVTIVNSTLSGNSGGGIYNPAALDGSVTMMIANTTLRNNAADSGGGIVNGGTLTITNCTLSGNSAISGGGIINGGTLTIANSTLSSNSAHQVPAGGGVGGGIDNGELGTVVIVNSTLSDNSANDGAGIFNFGTVTIANSTLSGNSADGGGGILNLNTVRVFNSTLSGNFGRIFGGGGIENISFDFSASVEIGNTILNAGGSGGTITNVSGTITSLGHNLSSDDASGLLTGPGDQINTDPMLGSLQDNGGPTFTHALLPGSPAIDAGDPNFTPPPDFDQRGPGFPRVVGGRIDIGAFEAQTLPDSDGDGVPDMLDQCPNTAPGSIVDADGCSIAQLAPCAGPATGGTWKSHGQYVAAVVHAATDFLKARLISRRQWMQIVTQAARSRCGWNRRCDRDGDRDWSRAWDCDRDADWGRDRDEGTRENRP